MTFHSLFLIVALVLLCVAFLCETGTFKMTGKPFETAGLVAFVASWMVSG